jgi:hypothetical protein
MRGTTGTTLIVDSSATTTGAANTGSQIEFWGSDGVSSYTWARIGGGKENGTSGNQASYFSIQTRANGGALTERLRVDSTGDMVIPNGKGLCWGDKTTFLANNALNTYFSLVVAGAERLRVDSSGNVGIGVIPDSDIVGNTLNINNGFFGSLFGPADYAFLSANAKPTTSTDAGSTVWKYKNNAYATRFDTRDGLFRWFTASSGNPGDTITWNAAMSLDNSGNLGIGTSSPTQKLDVVGSVDVCGQIRTTGTINSAFLSLSNGNGTTSYGYSYVRFLNNDATGQQWRIGTYGSNNFTIRDHTVGTARLVIDTSGNVMVGQTSPIYSMANRRVLNVDGASTALISVSSGGAGATSGYLYWDGGNLSLANNNTTGSLLFGTNGGTARMEITAAGVIQDGAGNELGWKNIPPVSNSFERAKCNVITANATVGTSNAGDVYSVYNNSSVSVTLTPSGVTMYLGGTNSTGARTLLPHGFATIWFRTSTECVINGNVT